jgi:hypothetical protein
MRHPANLMLPPSRRLDDSCACAVCNARVSGSDGDAKIYVGHEGIVLCALCFFRHPRRYDWLTPMPRSRPMLHD